MPCRILSRLRIDSWVPANLKRELFRIALDGVWLSRMYGACFFVRLMSFRMQTFVSLHLRKYTDYDYIEENLFV